MFNYSYHLALTPTSHPLREWCNVWHCVSSGTATAQPLGSNIPALFIQTLLFFLMLMEKKFIYRDVLF